MEITFDPQEYIRGIQNILVSDKKRIAFLFGAGTSVGFVPVISEMTKTIVEELSKEKKEYKNILEDIKKRIDEKNYNIESILSHIEQIINLIDDKTKLHSDIRYKIKDRIIEMVSVHKKLMVKDIENITHSEYADWIGKAYRKTPVEIFTTNYDYLFELCLENKEIPYYDGFTGSVEPFFNSDVIEDLNCYSFDTKLWKVHGSLGWIFNSKNKIIRSKVDSKEIIMFPSMYKYLESKKQPYISFMDRLYNFLKLDDTILFTCGYSFNDEHINERINSALNTNTTAHVVALYYDESEKEHGKGKKIKEYSLKEGSNLYNLAMKQNKLSAYGMRNAVIGCKYGKWKLSRTPDNEGILKLNEYFDEDAIIYDTDPIGEGRLIIPDFKKFVKFLKSLIIENEVKKFSELKQ